MVMKTGERWHCINPDCRCVVAVETSGEIDGANPICPCGAPMKKNYKSPVFRYLEFLHLNDRELVSSREHEK
jgi:hypothetical protein